MTSPLLTSLGSALHITAVERETGLSKDTLRVWERRYGFPQPLRSESDDRLYPIEQVQRLKRIRRLLDVGYRPGKVVHLADDELQALLGGTESLSKTNYVAKQSPEDLDALLSVIKSHDGNALRDELKHALMRHGMAKFVMEVIAPLTVAVGDAWADGRFEVFEEHLYTEVVTNVLRTSLAGLQHSGRQRSPKILLTTIPQEIHGLGLLMVESILTLENCQCVSLGTQTPISDIVLAAAAHHVDVVALSFTNLHTASSVQINLQALRSSLPSETTLWVGGSCRALYQKPWQGITAVRDLEKLPSLVAQWRDSFQAATC